MSAPSTNDLVHPDPRTEFPKARVLEFDFPGLEIGVAEYDEGPTGCTVFHLPKLASLSVPTLSIGSDCDGLVAPEQYELVPAQQKVCIRSAGHIPMIERPEEFNRILNDFLSGTHRE